MGPGPRFPRALATLIVLLAAVAPSASAKPMTVPYAPTIGESTTLLVRYLRVTAMERRPEPVISVEYELELTITSPKPDGFHAQVRSSRTNVMVNRQRVLDPPDFDSLLLVAVDGLTAELDITQQGAVAAVTNWDTLRAPLIQKAISLAGDNQALAETARTFLPSIDSAGAVQVFARALAISAPGRMIAFDPPDRMAAEAADAVLPSFATHARGRWSFDLLPEPLLPDSISVQWLGVPGPEALRAILATIGEQLSRIGSLDQDTRKAAEEDGQMWQRFSATYDQKTGRLLAFQATMELTAGPLQRRVAIEAMAKGR
ncbi:MAG: hypothetical protein GY798_26190 [Hyphomicrobiales bacterium]|nr:hypothetical protein [Hyphomicrobiales bacterium]